MGITIHYKIIVREQDIPTIADRMAIEATNRGMEVLKKGENLRAWTKESGDGIIISPDRGSEPLSLIFRPYTIAKKREMETAGYRSDKLKQPTKEDLEGARDYHVTEEPIVEVFGSVMGGQTGKPWKGVITERRDGDAGDYWVDSLSGGMGSAVYRWQVKEIDERGKPFGTKEVYHWFNPRYGKDFLDAFQPGTAILVGPSFTKTQFAENAVNAHIGVVELLDILRKDLGATVDVLDEGEYWETRDANRLAKNLGELETMIDSVGGALSDAAKKFGMDIQASIGASIGDSPKPEGKAEFVPEVVPSPDVKPAQRALKDFTKRREVHVDGHRRRARRR